MLERILALVKPHKDNWKPMLLGLAAFGCAVQGATLFRGSEVVSALLVLTGFLAWAIGACALVIAVRAASTNAIGNRLIMFTIRASSAALRSPAFP